MSVGLGIDKNVRCFRIFLENVVQEVVDTSFEVMKLVGPVSFTEMLEPFFFPRFAGRRRKILNVEHEAVHDAQLKMHAMIQEQEVLGDNFEGGHQLQAGPNREMEREQISYGETNF